ncbi:MAG: TIGR02206 family membrane protein [Fidelibacterota bacterium]
MFPPPIYGSLHLAYIWGWFAVWIIIPWLGARFLNSRQRRWVRYGLIVLTLAAEWGDDLNRYLDNNFFWSHDLPLHLCSYAIYLTCWALFTHSQTAFELAYFWGLAGASQAVFTPDLSAVKNHTYMFIFFFSHGIIILNVLWLVFVEKMSLRRGSLWDVILVTNGIAFLTTFWDKILNANYMYLCDKPQANSPFLIGGWPYYIIGMELFGILFMFLLYIPMWLNQSRQIKLQSAP